MNKCGLSGTLPSSGINSEQPFHRGKTTIMGFCLVMKGVIPSCSLCCGTELHTLKVCHTITITNWGYIRLTRLNKITI